jgi:hypothetical protein
MHIVVKVATDRPSILTCDFGLCFLTLVVIICFLRVQGRYKRTPHTKKGL